MGERVGVRWFNAAGARFSNGSSTPCGRIGLCYGDTPFPGRTKPLRIPLLCHSLELAEAYSERHPATAAARERNE
jgi:hypothetical protein